MYIDHTKKQLVLSHHTIMNTGVVHEQAVTVRSN